MGSRVNTPKRLLAIAVMTFFAALPAPRSSRAEGQLGVCEGTLHENRDGLRIGGGAGEGEGICLVGKADMARVLAVCTLGHHCRIKGQMSDCKDTGECAEISRITAVRRK